VTNQTQPQPESRAQRKLQIVLRAIGSIKPDPKNARSHPDVQISKLAKIIKDVGWTKPIVIDEKGMILAGHGALLAARLLELDVVPCVEVPGLTQAQKRAYVLADNRVAEDSTWNLGILEEELAGLMTQGIDMELTGFDAEELGRGAGANKSAGVTEIETSELHDRFWISIRGPLKHQAKVLQAMRKATAEIEGVQVELGTTDGLF
jgi:ParB-like chromosome segregation protein Spo0J